MIRSNITQNTLVIGGGVSAIFSAYRISRNKIPVWVIDQGEGFGIDPCFKDFKSSFEDVLKELKVSKNVYILEGARIKKLKGNSGCFNVLIETKEGIKKEIFGTIVIATPYRFNPVFSEFNLHPSDVVLSLADLEKKLEEFSDLDKKIAVFITRFDNESDPVTFRRIINDAISLTNLKAKVYVVAKNVKVAASGLEKLIDQAKERGVLILKSEEKPVTSQNGKLEISIEESIINENIKLLADFVIVEDEILPSLANQELADILRLDTDVIGFLQSDNVRRTPVYTNRKGIFVVGSATSIKPFNLIVLDSINVSYEVLSFLNKEIDIVEPPYVDHDKCVCCLTCYRVCPHGAILWDGNRITISDLACEGCGICAAECPMNAIQLKSYMDDSIRSQIREAISMSEIRPLILGFCCQNSAFEAFLGAKELQYDLPAGFRAIKVPCAGKVDMFHVLDALTNGADGVVICACHNGNCRSERGNLFATYRIEGIKRFLKEAGLNPDRVCLMNVASNMAKEFSIKLKDIEKKLIKN